MQELEELREANVQVASADNEQRSDKQQELEPSDGNGGGRDAHPISLAKLAANRPNAQHSTGPKTEAGKAQSRRNALKHGIFAANMFVYGENPSEYEELLGVLREDLAPESALEELLVEKLAICVWRGKRVLRCEGGLVRSLVGNSEKDMRDSRALPILSEHQMDRVLRYEGMIQRQLSSTLSQLERLQRARRERQAAAAVSDHNADDQ
jgi:hypothetical protein